MRTRWKVTVHNAESVRGRLAHWWNEGALRTECGVQCAYYDGPETKLATGWTMSGPERIDCPDCNMPVGL